MADRMPGVTEEIHFVYKLAFADLHCISQGGTCMKRTLASTLAFTMALSLCACGAGSSGETDPATSQTTEAAEEAPAA